MSFATEIINRITKSKCFNQVLNFLSKYATKTDAIMGGLFIGGYFYYPDLWGYDNLIAKLCSLYFVSKGSAIYLKECHPKTYKDIVEKKNSAVSLLCKTIIPTDYHTCYNVIKNLFEPYLSQFENVNTSEILKGIYAASMAQKPIELSDNLMNKNQIEFLERAVTYCEMAAGMYGPAMIYGLMHEIDEFSDVKHLLNGKKSKEGYKQAFLDHTHLKAEDILYINWGCEDSVEQTVVTTSSGIELTSPPYFLIRHEATKSLVLCIRGTWDIKDFISDFKCEGISWGSGKAHEGIALIANSILKDTQLNATLTDALKKDPDFQVVAVGHSLGAGIASLVTLHWRYNRMYKQPICYAIAPPPILSTSVWDKGVGYIYSFVNEDDIVPRLSKDAILQVLQSIVGNCEENKSWFSRMSSSVSENMQSFFGKNNTLVQLYLPGTVYYLHPCITNYEKYENTKRVMGNSDMKLIERVQVLTEKVHGIPGASIFPKGTLFPKNIILSPMVLFHHFINSYEEIMKNTLNVLKQEKCE